MANVPVNKALYSRVKQRLNVNLLFILPLTLTHGLYEYKKRGGTYPQELRNVARSSSGLTRWFKEKWVDVKTGKPCGRQKAKKRLSSLPTHKRVSSRH